MIVQEFNIRKYTVDDLPVLADIYNQSRAAEQCFKSDDVSARQFSVLIESEEIHVAEDKNQTILGFVSVWTAENFIHHLYVLPEYQHRGVGPDLIETCVNRYGLPLSLKSLVANQRACSFYERNHWIALEKANGVDGPYYHYWLRDV